MSELKSWFENDHLWDVTKTFLFGDKIWEAAADEVESALALLGVESGAAILDLCCGPGRHSVEMARRGYVVTGVDRTEQYLDMAKEKVKKEGLNVEFVLEDMRRFCRPDSFDGAINMFTSFGYVQDKAQERQIVSNFYNSLKRGGKILMDMVSKERITKIFQKRDWTEKNGIIMLEERTPIDNWRYLESRWILIKDGKREEFRIMLRIYSAVEIVDLLKGQGFRDVQIYGDLNGSDYDHNLKRLVVVAVK